MTATMAAQQMKMRVATTPITRLARRSFSSSSEDLRKEANMTTRTKKKERIRNSMFLQQKDPSHVNVHHSVDVYELRVLVVVRPASAAVSVRPALQAHPPPPPPLPPPPLPALPLPVLVQVVLVSAAAAAAAAVQGVGEGGPELERLRAALVEADGARAGLDGLLIGRKGKSVTLTLAKQRCC